MTQHSEVIGWHTSMNLREVRPVKMTGRRMPADPSRAPCPRRIWHARRLPFLSGGLSAFLSLMLLAGCFVVSEEGQKVSKIGGDLLVAGYSDELAEQSPGLGPIVQGLANSGAASVYPVEGDISPPAGSSSVTHHLIVRASKGDIVIRLRYDPRLRKFHVVDYFSPKGLRYFGGRWSVER
jgi:hypothetical protein